MESPKDIFLVSSVLGFVFWFPSFSLTLWTSTLVFQGITFNWLFVASISIVMAFITGFKGLSLKKIPWWEL